MSSFEPSVKKLKKIYKKEGVALALGAGASMGVGLPDWRTLLKKIGEDWSLVYKDLHTTQ